MHLNLLVLRTFIYLVDACNEGIFETPCAFSSQASDQEFVQSVIFSSARLRDEIYVDEAALSDKTDVPKTPVFPFEKCYQQKRYSLLVKTEIIMVKQTISLLLLNHFCPVIPIPTSSKEKGSDELLYTFSGSRPFYELNVVTLRFDIAARSDEYVRSAASKFMQSPYETSNAREISKQSKGHVLCYAFYIKRKNTDDLEKTPKKKCEPIKKFRYIPPSKPFLSHQNLKLSHNTFWAEFCTFLIM
ncbi:hypothetical protein WN51_12463 [Melipona quadrifasciata]|uniref:Uncharacterized protein n=1 Tax=Melipona quadrifasciata TaxID=166423 RepID=A0A0M9A5Q3_9HYME|nr:hypothetical protein WN51_12463 [Melipona quadrifasciata]